MAYQMIHMEVAYRILQRTPEIKHQAEFLLGSVAPDSVHMNSEYEVGMKVKSHMFEECGPWGDTRDYKRWLKNISDVFCESVQPETDLARRDFLLGLCVHCLTDYSNDRNIWRKLQGEHVPPMEFAEFKESYYPEARGIDQWLYQNSEHTVAIRKLLQDAKAFDINGLVVKEDLETMRKHLLYTQYEEETVDISKYRFLNTVFLETFIENTVYDISNWIASLKNTYN